MRHSRAHRACPREVVRPMTPLSAPDPPDSFGERIASLLSSPSLCPSLHLPCDPFPRLIGLFSVPSPSEKLAPSLQCSCLSKDLTPSPPPTLHLLSKVLTGTDFSLPALACARLSGLERPLHGHGSGPRLCPAHPSPEHPVPTGPPGHCLSCLWLLFLHPPFSGSAPGPGGLSADGSQSSLCHQPLFHPACLTPPLGTACPPELPVAQNQLPPSPFA